MKLLEAPVKISYTNPIDKWDKENTTNSTKKVVSYENGMFITIDNKGCYYNDLVKDFKELYLSLIVALTGKKVRRTDVKHLPGEWKGEKIRLPKRQHLLGLIDNKTPVLIAGVHNYELDDPRSKGKEYCHTHFYVYNTHHYLPSTPIELRDKEDKIERHLSRYIKSTNHKRFQGIIDIKPVRDNVSPTELYDYLQSPITNPDKNNLINYISNNRHLPSIQYPLTTIYSTKKV
tara:strand:- start:2810 stop:3505 length:696 start_codon:yes stop_codon:yes gene_type:complete